MKFASSQLAYLFSDRGARANIGALLKYIGVLAALITVHAVVVHLTKLYLHVGQPLMLGSLDQRRAFAEAFEEKD
jgi:hypothetical protein